MELFIVELVIENHNFQCCVRKRKLDDSDYLDRFLLRLHALIDVYPSDFLG